MEPVRNPRSKYFVPEDLWSLEKTRYPQEIEKPSKLFRLLFSITAMSKNVITLKFSDFSHQMYYQGCKGTRLGLRVFQNIGFRSLTIP